MIRPLVSETDGLWLDELLSREVGVSEKGHLSFYTFCTCYLPRTVAT